LRDYQATLGSVEGLEICMTVIHAPNYWGFFDGSGKPSDRRFISYCGYVCGVDDGERFTDAWASLCRQEFLPYLSMKEAVNWRGAWDNKRRQWGEQADAERRRLLLQFADIVRDGPMFGFGFSVDVSQMTAKQVPATELYLFAKCLEDVLKAVDVNARLSIIVDEEEKYAEQFYGMFRRLRQQRHEIANHWSLIGLGNDEVWPGLQAADLLARAVADELDRVMKRPSEPQDELYVRLTHSTSTRSMHIGEIFTDRDGFLEVAGIV
jgi:hypothetical protein